MSSQEFLWDLYLKHYDLTKVDLQRDLDELVKLDPNELVDFIKANAVSVYEAPTVNEAIMWLNHFSSWCSSNN